MGILQLSTQPLEDLLQLLCLSTRCEECKLRLKVWTLCEGILHVEQFDEPAAPAEATDAPISLQRHLYAGGLYE